MPDAFRHEVPGCTVAEERAASVAILRVRAAPSDLLDRVAAILGRSLPVEPNRAIGAAPRLFWHAPGEWLIVDGAHRHAALADAIAGHTAVFADIGEGRTRFRVEGAIARDLLSKGTSLDLHPRVFGEGQCARTLFAQAQVLIDRQSEGFDLYADISLAAHMRRWFADALIEFDGGRR